MKTLKESILSSTKTGKENIIELVRDWFKENVRINKRGWGEEKKLVQSKYGVGISCKEFNGVKKKDRFLIISTYDKDDRSKIVDIPNGISKEYLESFEDCIIYVHEKIMNKPELKKVIDKLPKNFKKISIIGPHKIGITGKDKSLLPVDEIVKFIKTYKDFIIYGHFDIYDIPGWDSERISETWEIIKQAMKYSKYSEEEQHISIGGKSYTEAERKRALGL